MSPAIARAAATAAARRPSSIVMQIRSIGRAMEHPPFERIPVTQKPARADWVKEIKSVAGRAVIYVPGIGLLLGWPLIAKELLDGHI